MRKVAIILVVLATRASAQAAEISSGSGVMIGDHGEVLANAHVVDACAQIIVRSPAGEPVPRWGMQITATCSPVCAPASDISNWRAFQLAALSQDRACRVHVALTYWTYL
jgi:hypothetical protein